MLKNNNKKLVGIIWFCIAGFLSTVININMRYLNEDLGYHPFQLVFCYSLLGAMIYAPMLRKGKLSLKTSKVRLYNIRALLEISGFSFIFFALSKLPFAVLVTLTFTAPLIGTIFAIYILHEKLNILKIIGLLVGFGGIIIVSNPSISHFNLYYLLPICAAFCFALCGVLIRIMARTEPPSRIAVRTLVMMAIFSAPAALANWQTPILPHLPYFIAMAAMVALVQLAVGNALQKIELNVAHPFMFLNLIWASLFGYIIFAEQLQISTAIGGAVIILGIVINAQGAAKQ